VTPQFSHTLTGGMLRRAALVLFFTIAVLAIATAAATRWLEVEDPVVSCHAVVALNGDQPARADEAARLHAAGYAAEVWLTNDPWSGNADVPDAGTVSNVRRLAARGVPAPVIRVLDGQARGTAAELAIIRAEGLRRGASCLVVVTSPAHARRVKLTWKRLVTPRPLLVVRHAPGAGYAGWKTRAQELWLVAAVLAGRD
jgi:hypothetical protein